MAFTFCLVSTAQNVIREGHTFKTTITSRSRADTLMTDFKWEDSKGKLYNITVNKKTGRCWVWKKSGKTGKMYKQYMNEYVSKTVCDMLGIPYPK